MSAFFRFWPFVSQVCIYRLFLTSAIHEFTDISGGHYLIGAQIISNLATDGHNDGHDKVGKCRNDPNLLGEHSLKRSNATTPQKAMH